MPSVRSRLRTPRAQRSGLVRGDAIDLIQQEVGGFDLIATDPPYAFGGQGEEHAVSATVAVVLRESAKLLKEGRFMLVMCASSWRSQSYMVESVRGVLDPIRVGTWCKPRARSRVQTSGWAWASVSVIVFRRGRSGEDWRAGIGQRLDHITAEPLKVGRRAELPDQVAAWMVEPFKVVGGRFLDPFAGSGKIVEAAAMAGMRATGYERKPK